MVASQRFSRSHWVTYITMHIIVYKLLYFYKMTEPKMWLYPLFHRGLQLANNDKLKASLVTYSNTSYRSGNLESSGTVQLWIKDYLNRKEILPSWQAQWQRKIAKPDGLYKFTE